LQSSTVITSIPHLSFFFSLVTTDALLLYWQVMPEQADDAPIDPPNPQALADRLFNHSEKIRAFKYSLSEKERAGIDTTRVVKFDGDDFEFGTVMEYGPATETNGKQNGSNVWTIHYDNGDVDELNLQDLKEAGERYREYKAEDPTPINTDHIALHEAYVPETLRP
jgi:hypothetical protein